MAKLVLWVLILTWGTLADAWGGKPIPPRTLQMNGGPSRMEQALECLDRPYRYLRLNY